MEANNLTNCEEGSGSVGVVIDLGLKGNKLKTQRRHSVVSLSKTFYPMLSTGLTWEDRKPSRYD